MIAAREPNAMEALARAAFKKYQGRAYEGSIGQLATAITKQTSQVSQGLTEEEKEDQLSELFCSELVAQLWIDAGLVLVLLTSLPHPICP